MRLRSLFPPVLCQRMHILEFKKPAFFLPAEPHRCPPALHQCSHHSLRPTCVGCERRGAAPSRETVFGLAALPLGYEFDDETKIAFLTQIAAKQEQILMQLGADNPLVSAPQYVNTLRSITEIGGFKDVDQFFNPPQVVAQTLAMQKQQAAQQQPQQDPALMMAQQKAQMDMQLAQQKAEAEIALKRERMQAELELEREKMIMEMDMRRQELEAEAQLRVAKAVTDAEISTNLPRAQ